MFGADDANIKIDRRQLLRGQIRNQLPPLRPPWAQTENSFVALCNRCDDCVNACEAGLLFRGSGGFPEIRFQSAGCDFCGDCLQACTTNALHAPVPAPSLAWHHRAVIADSCLSRNGIVCRSCAEACDSDAIRFQLQTGGRATPLLNLEHCNGCGECLAVCPNHSISLEIPEAQ
ncbi:ferredoxin-type protein NapF [Thiolapillus sp.]